MAVMVNPRDSFFALECLEYFNLVERRKPRIGIFVKLNLEGNSL